MDYIAAEYGDDHNMTPSPLDEIIRPGSNQNLDFIDLDELRKKSATMPSNILTWALQEMLCNSLDTDAIKIEVTVKTIGAYNKITVKDNGTTKITLNDLHLILDFSNKASSKRGLLRVTRGTHGNALKCLFGYSYTLAKRANLTPPETQVISQGTTFNIHIVPNKIKQEIEHKISTNDILSANYNSFIFKFPNNRPTIELHENENKGKILREAQRLEELIHATGIVNPTRRINYNFWNVRKGAVGKAGELESIKKDTSLLWYEPTEFTELLYDFIRSRPKTQLKELIAIFRGFTGKKVIREILCSFNESRARADSINFSPSALLKDLSQQDVELLYRILRARAKPISKRSIQHVLGCVGEIRFEALREQQYWANLKYLLLKDRVVPTEAQRTQASFPYLVEIAVFDRSPDDTEGPKIFQCVNFMASKLPLFNRVFDVNSRLAQVGINRKTPITIVIHLVSPVPKWLNFAKTSIGGAHLRVNLKKAFDKLLPIPKQPRGYKYKKPKKPVSWFPRGKITNVDYQKRLRHFAGTMRALDNQRGRILDKVSARGWGYILEGMGKVHKGEFDALAKSINDCIKRGYLPINFTAADQDPTRRFTIHEASSPGSQLRDLQEYVDRVLEALPHHTTEYWMEEEYYLMMFVEKIDIYNLFKPICQEYNVPISNSKGWYTLKPRFQIGTLSRRAEARGQKPVLLLFYDHDIAGLKISQKIRKGLEDMKGATKWDPSGLIIDRFGLNYDEIEKFGLSWIDNLKSGSGRDPDIKRKDVKEYVGRFGHRKCEANALLKDEGALRIGQNLCRNAIEKYYGADALARFKRKTEESRSKLSHIFENLIWNELRDTLSELVEKDDEKQLGEYAPACTETDDIVKIYERTEDGNYLWGKCPKCKTLFDYDRSCINKTLRCRVCNAPMKLIKAN